MRVTEDHIFVTAVSLGELGVPSSSAGTVTATLVAMYYERVGGYTERTTFVADVQVAQGKQGIYLKCSEWSEWRSVFPDELPQSKVMVTFDPDDPRIWRGLPKFDKHISPVAVYMLL